MRTPPPRYLADRTLATIARGQAGAFSRDQARKAGLREGTIRGRLARGEWAALHRGVYCAATLPRSITCQFHAALLALGTGAVLSHVTAAAVWGLDLRRRDDEVWVSVPHARRAVGVAGPGLHVVRCRHLTGSAVTTRSQLPVTSPARTLADLGQLLDHRALTGVVLDALRGRLVTVPRILAACEQLGPRHGTGAVRRVCRELDVVTESVAEQTFLRLARQSGIVALVAQFRVWDGPLLVARLDFAIPELRLAIEVDGMSVHMTPTAGERDRQRDRQLALLGWVTVRFTAQQIALHPDQVAAELVALVAARSAELRERQ